MQNLHSIVLNIKHNNAKAQSAVTATNCMIPTNIQVKHSMNILTDNHCYMLHNGISQVTKSESAKRHTRHHWPLTWLLLSCQLDPPFSGLYIRHHQMNSDSFFIEFLAITMLHASPCFLSLLSTTPRSNSWILIRAYNMIATVLWHNYTRHCVILEKHQPTSSPPNALW